MNVNASATCNGLHSVTSNINFVCFLLNQVFAVFFREQLENNRRNITFIHRHHHLLQSSSFELPLAASCENLRLDGEVRQASCRCAHAFKSNR